MAQPVPVPSAHSVRVFGGDGFLVKYFVSAKSAKRFEHSCHCSFKSFFFFQYIHIEAAIAVILFE